MSRSRSARLVCAATLTSAAVLGSGSPSTAAGSSAPFTLIASLGDSAPGGGTFAAGADFEPYSLNSSGEVAFAADMSTGGEGVFVGRPGVLRQIARSGDPAPGGGTLGGFGVLGNVALNDGGDVAFSFGQDPFQLPIGLGAGVYRQPAEKRTLRAVVVPSVTSTPSGAPFVGAGFRAAMNNAGDIVFAGMEVTNAGIPGSPPLCPGPRPEPQPCGMGVFRATSRGVISTVATPGDPAPGGGTFDFAQNPWINDAGDVAFGAHVRGEECIRFNPPEVVVFCAESVYVKKAATGVVSSIAHMNDPAPGGGVFRLAFGPVINSRGDILFIGDLTPAPRAGESLGVFLRRGRMTVPVARPGDPMPGGGKIMTGPFQISNYSLNDRGDVAFLATLDNDANGDTIADTGLYVWSKGVRRLVARSGTVVPGVGTISHLDPPSLVGDVYPHGGAILNDRGRVLFQATLADGRGVLLLSNPPAPRD